MNHNSRKRLIPVAIIVVVLIASIWYFIQANGNGTAADIQASGTVETVEVRIASEISGKVVEVLVEKGDSVARGDLLFRLDDELLQAQRRQALGILESAKAGLQLAETGLAAAESNLELAKSSLDLANTQYQITDQAVRAADFTNRQRAWRADVPYEFDLPVWYFDKAKRIEAAQAEVEAAKAALEQDQADLDKLVKESGNQDLIDAEARLVSARAAFEIADEVLDRADAQNVDDCTELSYALEHPQECQDKNWSDTHISDSTYNQAENSLEDVAQDARDAAKAELYAAQDEYQAILKGIEDEEIGDAHARVTMAIERYQLAQDYLYQLYTGEDSLQLKSAQEMVAQAEATVNQAEVSVTQANAALEQAQASVNQAQAEIDLVDVQISKLDIRSAVDGVVMTRSIEPGEVVQAGSVALSVGELERLTITVYIAEDRYGQIKLGDTASVTADPFPGDEFSATVSRIADQAEFTPRNVQTDEGRRTTVFAVELSVDNPDGSLKPGMPVDVAFGN